jgi:glycosyltransferase involved in cell wall biosynthesis
MAAKPRKLRASGVVQIVAVIDGYRLTGPARQLLAVAKAQAGSGVRTSLAIFQRTSVATPFVSTARAGNVPVQVLPDRFPGDLRTILSIARLSRSPDTSILQTHGYKANVLARVVAPFARCPWIAVLHGETWESAKVRAYFALERLAVRAADRVLVVSESMARSLVARGLQAGKVRVVHNACLIEGVSSDEAHVTPKEPIIGVVGRLSPEKGVEVALRVFELVRRRVPSAQLYVVGEGPERVALEEDARRLGLGDSVVWLGYQEDLKRLYSRMSVFLLPSRSEGLPNVVLEAMALGLPVVATAVGGVPEVVTDGRSGFLTSSEDVEGLARRVADLLEDEPLRQRLAQDALHDVRSRFSLGARLSALEQIYREVLA